jgi:hypothetical protein
MLMALEPYVSAEIDYRLDRAAKQFGQPKGRRHWVPRRPSLRLPPMRPRPLPVG